MVKPDLIIIWPRAYDYPVCRSLVSQNRDNFGKVIVSFTHNDVERDYREWLKETHPDFTFVDCDGGVNWYDEAINIALEHVESEYVMFLEQDFFFDAKFLRKILNLVEDRDFVCLEQGSRLHLACFVTKMKLINKTLRHFQAIGRYGLDCFDLFCAEIIIKSRDWSTLEGFSGYKHLNGLTHNLRLGIQKDFKLMYEPKEFKHYLNFSLKMDVKQNPEWVKITKEILKEL